MDDSAHAADQAELRRLRWRCRRGMRELDQLMLRYLDHRWPEADAAERAEFERLLGVEDDRLWRWVMGREACDDAGLAALLERIASLPA
ncbi:succinate dehydrogenase assembly factor 2 [Pseudomarimonas salicorniae]|uniref:FAD assembly factor SdhE n=1 Tax=Pseudomarimonas salicorniae TaxID=2933270 RepID=A0ABT0GEH2_9GAMM|nr:succinate dehydrogenase assembly factor 2 [Lysobacter sp. CAU 1642]MCK7592954.1 succinate dehydrogenase assembly factor 2 [Lysobacter sp. CAU 1642]